MDENLPANSGTYREDSFDIAVRGYNRQQVAEYMSRSNQLLASLEQHLAVARADVERARAEADQAQADLQRVRTEQAETKPVHESVSERMSQILRLATEEADQERATADAEIAKLHEETQTEAERILTEARLAADRDLAEARDTAERELGEAKATAERELSEAREEADRLRLVSARHAEELLDDAQRRSGAINDVSNQRLETLTGTHGEAVLRLSQIRDVLADLLDRDAAAGSLAQVVEAVIAPAGAPAQLEADSDEIDDVDDSADVADAADDEPDVEPETASEPDAALPDAARPDDEPVTGDTAVQPAVVDEADDPDRTTVHPAVPATAIQAAVPAGDSLDDEIDLRDSRARVSGTAR